MEDDLNKLIELWSSSTNSVERQQIIDHIIDHRKYKYTVKSLLDNKNFLFEQCQKIHHEIIRLQEISKENQDQVKTINNFLTQLYNIDYQRLTNENNCENKEIENKEIKNKQNKEIENVKNKEIENKQNKEIENKKEEENKMDKQKLKSNEDQKLKAVMKHKMHKKARMIKSFKRGLQPKSEAENLKERDRIVKEIQKYTNVNFEKLQVVKVLCDSADHLDSIKLMENNIIRIRFKPVQKSSFNQQILILKYLNKCDITPRLLHFNSNKQTVYLPYYGDPPLNTPENRRNLSLIVRKLKRNWGVYQLKNGQVLNSIKPHTAMLSSKLNNRFFLYDFTAPEWVVDRNRSYPMIN